MNIQTVVTLAGFHCWVKLLEGSCMHTINLIKFVCTTMKRSSKHAEQPNCCGYIDMLVDWYCVTYCSKLYRHCYRYNQNRFICICLYLCTCISWKHIINILHLSEPYYDGLNQFQRTNSLKEGVWSGFNYKFSLPKSGGWGDNPSFWVQVATFFHTSVLCLFSWR